ncbi:prepilin-type N-terminal cleavage/methylation domain-containing protein [Pseudomonas sp. 2FG]|uniref:prepilin-type N-terminal cleavage/methylation domain-containing protein n=1 Tax=Pseudomonas sp. 2FG TaxID=2502191 RepID=UPI0010F454AC|nr:prepilin-type N-terminal cleavage/methylation domain-containing protein [Pseudomonas sp. 2FG]
MKRQRGMTLVELVIAIVIIGIAAAALYSAMAAISGRSADPLLRQQSLAIAEAYLEEILLQAYLDPSSAVCPAPPANRADYDNVCDYAGLVDNGARDASGQAIAALAAYGVSVTVTPQAWNGLAEAAALYVEVTVLDPAGQSLVLGGYRTRY